MQQAYENWIAVNVKDTYGNCVFVTLQMQKAFPSLIRVRGHYHCPVWGKRPHWWLKTDSGEIVDPTASQFPSQGGGRYVEWVEGSEEPTGKCLNCGDYVYRFSTHCSEKCEQETRVFMAL